jgi:hypothetical protein
MRSMPRSFFSATTALHGACASMRRKEGYEPTGDASKSTGQTLLLIAGDECGAAPAPHGKCAHVGSLRAGTFWMGRAVAWLRLEPSRLLAASDL